MYIKLKKKKKKVEEKEGDINLSLLTLNLKRPYHIVYNTKMLYLSEFFIFFYILFACSFLLILYLIPDDFFCPLFLFFVL
jgi:hypothetical protein